MWLVVTRLLLLFPSFATADDIIRVRYGYFPEARPIHAACGRGWFDFARPGGNYYKVTCYPQTSGNFATSRLDNAQLDIANLGSTPLAEAVARGLDLKVIYLSHYMGESQGIYVREPIQNPFDLRGHIVGVPFGSTMHYQVLFLLDLFGLTGDVDLVDLAPTEIIQAWNEGTIDAGACWGVARDHLLKNSGQGNPNLSPAKTLLTAGVMGDWGRPTFVAVAANRFFLDAHQEFMSHFVGILSR
jgi:taurine transport system substrate-binding protein